MANHRPWMEERKEIISRLLLRSKVYMFLGFGVYVSGSIALVTLVPDKSMALVLQMILFQSLIIYIFTKEIFVAIRGSFETMIASSDRSIPSTDKLTDVLEKIEKLLPAPPDPGEPPLDLKAEARTIREELHGIKEALTRPIKKPPVTFVKPSLEAKDVGSDGHG